jgi:hypothetical protein
VFTGRFLLADGVLISLQAALVAMPGQGLPRRLERFRTRDASQISAMPRWKSARVASTAR